MLPHQKVVEHFETRQELSCASQLTGRATKFSRASWCFLFQCSFTTSSSATGYPRSKLKSDCTQQAHHWVTAGTITLHLVATFYLGIYQQQIQKPQLSAAFSVP